MRSFAKCVHYVRYCHVFDRKVPFQQIQNHWNIYSRQSTIYKHSPIPTIVARLWETAFNMLHYIRWKACTANQVDLYHSGQQGSDFFQWNLTFIHRQFSFPEKGRHHTGPKHRSMFRQNVPVCLELWNCVCSASRESFVFIQALKALISSSFGRIATITIFKCPRYSWNEASMNCQQSATGTFLFL